MNLKKIFLLLVLIAGSAGVFFTNANKLHEASIFQTVNDEIITHTVTKGETVYSIAATYNTTVSKIYELNPKAERGIKTGDKLRILKVTTVSGYSDHTIEAKETLYSVSRMYHISVDDIKNANPGLNENNFSIGKRIKIPVYGNSSRVVSRTVTKTNEVPVYDVYKVKKGETLYSIGKTNNVTVEALLTANPSVKESGLKEGMQLAIPTGRTRTESTNPIITVQENPRVETSQVSKGETVRVGVLFSFMDDNSSIQKDKIAEYYEGFLLAVRELKEKGLNAEIYTFDIGTEKSTKKLESLLGTNEMKSLHLIIGGVSKPQIDMLTKFSRQMGIKYVIPFGSTSQIGSDMNLFQMTTSHSNLYSEVTVEFVRKFEDYNIIFASEAGSNNDKSDFTNELKKGLTKSGIQFKTVNNSANLQADIKAAMNSSKKNILVPTSSSEGTLRKIITSINTLSSGSLSLFGYPEWQAYTQHTESLHKFDSYIYSIFFLDAQQSKVQDIANDYKKWYNKNMINSFPKWGYLGYDTGLFFLTALKQYGTYFDENIHRVKVSTLQSAINFEHANNQGGGYINNGIYLVHYKTNSDIEKTDISK